LVDILNWAKEKAFQRFYGGVGPKNNNSHKAMSMKKKKDQIANKKHDSREDVNTFGADYDTEDVFAGAEPWEPIETKIVIGSFVAALFFLIVLGTLVNIYFLK